MNVSFFGRLTKAPEVKTNQTGTSYTTFTVATQVQAKGQDGKAKTLFVDVSAFGKQGDTIVKYFGKGSRIVIHGDIFDANAWVGKNDGQPHIGVNVTMSGFDFVDTQAESARPTSAKSRIRMSFRRHCRPNPAKAAAVTVLTVMSPLR